MRSGDHSCRARTRGFTFVWVLAALAVFSLGLAAVGPMWADQARREREQDLLRIGGLYAQAIASYYAASPGSLKQYPSDLNSLLTDTRFVGVRRHLRRLYPDPLDPTSPWGLVTDQEGRIRGVYSRSGATPFRQQAVDVGTATLAPAQHYSDWKFVPPDSR